MSVKSDNHSNRNTKQLFPALLFFVFLLCTIFTILIGSRVYENIRARNQKSFQTDTALTYISNKVRQGDLADSVSLREEDGRQVLILTAVYNETEFETWIYQMDGALWELFTQKNSGLDVYAGQMIMECDPISFSIVEKGNGSSLLCISMKSMGTSREAKLLLRSHQKGGAAS